MLVGNVNSLQRLCIAALSKFSEERAENFDVPEEYYTEFLDCCVRNKRISVIYKFLSSLENFVTLVHTKENNVTFYTSTQILVDNNIPIQNEITDQIIKKGDIIERKSQLRVCEFLMECGWYRAAGKLLNHLHQSMSRTSERDSVLVVLTHLITTNIAECRFNKARDAFIKAHSFYDPLKDTEYNPALLYGEECYRHYCLSNFSEANKWADLAVNEINETLDVASCITVLRKAAKVYINTRRFARAEALIKHAVNLAGVYYGHNHPLYADTLQDFGFCLLHLDMVSECVVVYHRAVEIIDTVFGVNNIKTAVAHEDLAYAIYVNDYNNGNYVKSLEHAEISVEIVNKLLEPDHLLHASTSRLRALILEEMAFDEMNTKKKEKLLKEAQDLHNKSLRLCRSVLGEDNIQTAKHYGNLGRLYQSMKLFKAAEKMHKRAIKIKESLLGPDNYELALSLGHLASLYNYDMERYDQALPLYLRSIQISLTMFGAGFSGLEYDYRGLIHLYRITDQTEGYIKYLLKLQDWIELRETQNQPSDNELFNNQSAALPTKTLLESLNEQ